MSGSERSGKRERARKERPMTNHEPVNPIQVQKFLGGMDYLTDKQTLLLGRPQQGASQAVLETLRRLPDQPYHRPKDVSE